MVSHVREEERWRGGDKNGRWRTIDGESALSLSFSCVAREKDPRKGKARDVQVLADQL